MDSYERLFQWYQLDVNWRPHLIQETAGEMVGQCRNKWVLCTLLSSAGNALSEQGFDPKYERVYNINPAAQYKPDNPLNPAQAYAPDNLFNPVNRYDPGNPLNPANQYNPNNPFNPANQYNPDNPLNPANRFNPSVPFEPLNRPYRSDR